MKRIQNKLHPLHYDIISARYSRHNSRRNSYGDLFWDKDEFIELYLAEDVYIRKRRSNEGFIRMDEFKLMPI